MAKLPTSSKLANDCLRSYPEWSKRGRGIKGTAADDGVRLHKIIQNGFSLDHNGRGDFDFVGAREEAIELDVFDKFRQMDFGLIRSIYRECYEDDDLYFEFPFEAYSSPLFGRHARPSEYQDFDVTEPIPTVSGLIERSALIAGTIDFAYDPGPDNDSFPTVIDWKTGIVEAEPAEENQQMLSLGHMFGAFLKVKTVRLVLAYVTLGKSTEHVLDVDLNKYMRELDFQPVKFSPQNCQYCKRKDDCVEYFERTKKLVNRE